MQSTEVSPASGSVVAKGVVIVVGTIVALLVAKFLFSMVVTLVKTGIFLAIIGAVVWFGYQMISSSDSSAT